MGVVQVLTDEVTRAKLGVDGLAEVQRNLWPVNCQSCGQALGDDPPVLCVDDMLAYATASLHHLACQPPRWRAEGRLTPARRTTAASRLFVAPFAVGGVDGVPMVLVNPSFEAVLLAGREGRWQVNTVGAYSRLGLRPMFDMNGRQSIQEATAALHDGVVVVQLTSSTDVERWRCAADEGAAVDKMTELRRVLLGVTTLVRPDEANALRDVVAAAEARQVAMGWIDLT